jgi:hypothetical protein
MLSSEFVSALCCGLLLSGCGGGEPQSETSPKGDKTQEQPEPAAPSTADTVCSADAPLVTIPPEDPEVQYSGRFDFSDPTRPVGSASGVSVSLRFRGDSVRVSFEDQFLWNSDTNVNQGYYDVIVDDLEPVKLEPVKGVTDYDVPVELPCEEHTVTLFKRTEANIGNFTFLGFQVAQALDAPAPPEHRILVIGDSITCGSGVDAQDGTPECASDGATGYWGQPYENAYGAWGSVLARAVGAERQTVCESGKGLVRNYSDQYDARPIPEV